MNTAEFNGGSLSLRREMSFIGSLESPLNGFWAPNQSVVPFSVALIVISLTLAFSPIARAFIALVFDLAWTKLITGTRLYNIWLRFDVDSSALIKFRLEKTERWKRAAKMAEQKRRWKTVSEEGEATKQKKSKKRRKKTKEKTWPV
jgi:hypothetical protein